MGRFKKLNDDIKQLGDMVLQDQDLCKLIYYPDDNPLEQPDINGRKILGERLLLLTPKLPLAKEEGTYVSILPTNIMLVPNRGDLFIRCLLCFEIYCHIKSRPIMYKDKNGNIRDGDRVVFIMDKIEEIMDNIEFSIGEPKLNGARVISNTNATFSGYEITYKDFDFKNRSK